VAHRGPVRIVLALRPTRLGDLGFKHRSYHRHPGGNAHRHQPFTRGAGNIGHRQLDLLWQIGKRDGFDGVSEATL
jgi:hypothetical protein